MAAYNILLVVLTLSALAQRALCTSSREDKANVPLHKKHALVGRLFYYQLPNDFDDKRVTHWEIVNWSAIPSWLAYDESNNLLQGIAEKDSSGDRINLQVAPVFDGMQGPLPSDTKAIRDYIIAIEVIEDNFQFEFAESDRTGHNVVEPVWCDAGAPVTKAAVSIDVHAGELKTIEKIALLKSFAAHFKLAVISLRIVPVTAQRQIYDSLALASGPGNKVSLQDDRMVIEWAVGCGNVVATQIPVLQQLERSASDGSLAKVTGYDVAGWHVINIKPRHGVVRRIRRKIPRKTYLDLKDPVFYSGDGNVDDSANPAQPTTRINVLPTLPSPRTSTTTPNRISRTTTTPGISNNPPLRRSPLRMISVRVGEALNFTIPRDTFYDMEDGDTTKLRLDLVAEDGLPLARGFWLKFIAEKQMVLALPRSEHEGRHSFLLRAIDSQGETDQERLRIRVWPRRRSLNDRPATYESSVRLDYDFWTFSSDVERSVDLLQRIAVRLYKNENTSSLTMTRMQEGSVIISWVNTSVSTQDCDPDTLRKLHRKIVGSDGRLTKEFVAAIAPYQIMRYSSEVAGVCISDDALVKELSVDINVDSVASTVGPSNSRPALIRPLGSIRLHLGRAFNYSIPADMFYDREDGNTRLLKLIFLANDTIAVPRSSWVLLNEADQSFYGLPMQPGKFRFMLVAVDSGGLLVKDEFDFEVVERRADRAINHEFILFFKLDNGEFGPGEMTQKGLDFVWRIAHLYGDVDPTKITVLRFQKGSTEFAWMNNTIVYEPCPVKRIGELMSRLITVQNKINEALIEEFQPYYIEKVEAEPFGPCKSKGVVPIEPLPTTTVPGMKPPATVPSDEVSERASQTNNIVMTAAVPVAIIVVIVVIVLCAVCLLYTRRRKGKLNLTESSKPPVKVGAPVIFADEFAERPESPTKPLILEREQPPLSPPPEYPRSGGGNGTLRSEHRSLMGGSSENGSVSRNGDQSSSQHHKNYIR